MFALVNSVVLLDWFTLVLCVLIIATWFGMIRYGCYGCCGFVGLYVV